MFMDKLTSTWNPYRMRAESAEGDDAVQPPMPQGEPELDDESLEKNAGGAPAPQLEWERQ